MKSDKNKLSIKIIALKTIYNLCNWEAFDLKLFIVLKYYFKFTYFEILKNLQINWDVEWSILKL